MSVTLALGLPHTPWVPERAASLARLREQLELVPGVVAEEGESPRRSVRVFDERESNKVWPRKMWLWALETGASHFVTLQDDTTVSPDFWPALRAMLEAVPDEVIGLSAVHPLGPEVQRQGRRWYRTPSWLVGWAYVVPRALLADFVTFVDANPHRVATTNEDTLLGEWVRESGRSVWHPVPTIVDHDTSIASTYDNDEHLHRRATVTWRAFAREDLVDPGWWRGGGPLLANPSQGACWWCEQRQGEVRNEKGVLLCRACVGVIALQMMGLRLGAAT